MQYYSGLFLEFQQVELGKQITNMKVEVLIEKENPKMGKLPHFMQMRQMIFSLNLLMHLETLFSSYFCTYLLYSTNITSRVISSMLRNKHFSNTHYQIYFPDFRFCYFCNLLSVSEIMAKATCRKLPQDLFGVVLFPIWYSKSMWN